MADDRMIRRMLLECAKGPDDRLMLEGERGEWHRERALEIMKLKASVRRRLASSVADDLAGETDEGTVWALRVMLQACAEVEARAQAVRLIARLRGPSSRA